MSPKKHRLSVSVDEDYSLIGISSDEPDYKLCWLINDSLATSFMKSDDLSLYNKKLGVEQLFSMFVFNDEDSMLCYRIIRNSGDNGYFLPELSKLDFILHIQGDMIQKNTDDFIVKLSKIDAVRMCVRIIPEKLKEQNRFLLW